MVLAMALILVGTLLVVTVVLASALRSRLDARREPEARRQHAAFVFPPAPPVEDLADARHRRAS